jgi:hypothetical protein
MFSFLSPGRLCIVGTHVSYEIRLFSSRIEAWRTVFEPAVDAVQDLRRQCDDRVDIDVRATTTTTTTLAEVGRGVMAALGQAVGVVGARCRTNRR